MTEEKHEEETEETERKEQSVAGEAESKTFGGETRVVTTRGGREIVVPAESASRRRWLLAGTAVMVIVAAIIRGFGVYYFIRPNNFAVGGIGGIALMLEYITHVNQGWWNIMFQAPILIMAGILLSRRYFAVTTLFTLAFSVATIALEKIDAAVGSVLSYGDGNTAILAAVCGGVMLGLSYTIMMRLGGSQGGTDAIGSLINKKRPDMSVQWLVFALDSAVILASAFLYGGLTPVILAIIEVFATSMVGDALLKGAKSRLKAEIVTVHCDEICAEIFERLGRGVTVVNSVGQYTGTERKLLNCVITRRQLGELQRILRKYPDTFSYIVPANEVYGYWKK